MNNQVNMDGLVWKLFIRDSECLITADKILLKTNLGIEGDVKSSPFSPCHVLIVDKEILDTHDSNYGDLNENICVQSFNTFNLKQGNIVCVGSAKLKIMYANEPCQIVASHIKENRGVLAIVVEGGEIKIGDKINLSSNNINNIIQNRSDLFSHFVKNIPSGKIVTYKEVIKAIGGTKSHLRIIPSFIKKGLNKNLPVHRITDSSGNLISKYIPNQASLLQQEGVRVYKKNRIDTMKYTWDPQKNIYSDI